MSVIAKINSISGFEYWYSSSKKGALCCYYEGDPWDVATEVVANPTSELAKIATKARDLSDANRLFLYQVHTDNGKTQYMARKLPPGVKVFHAPR